MQRIDGHVHFYGDQAGADLLESLDIRALNICVADGNWRQSDHQTFGSLASQFPDRFAWITSFDVPDYSVSDGDYADRVIAALDEDFKRGAVGCKAWKNIGMEVRNPAGQYVMIDDPIFTPIFNHLEREGRSVVMHIGEPLACWKPLEPNTPHFDYYRTNPHWHMHGRTDMPSHEALIAARDHVMERHPNLRLIGAHYGSLEYDVAEVAKRFDRYPNFAVDTSARLGDAAYQDRQAMREFCIKYQNRIIWGTDEQVKSHVVGSTNGQYRKALDRVTATYELEWNFFAGDKDLTVQGIPCRGLALPDEVIQKMFHDNAKAWYPGL